MTMALTTRRERVEAEPEDLAGGLRGAVEGLMGALDVGGAELPEELTAQASRTLGKAGERLAFTGAHTVVALAGATGSGKSSLFNRLVGDDVATVGQRRPTTSRITAGIWGQDAAGSLLDWLGVGTRHQVKPSRRGRTDEDAKMDGLIVLDLPDFDSYREENRAEADRVLELADVFVWVTDPQKYADSLLHDEYLQRVRHHQTVTLVVLNQADKMRSDQAKACRDDLRRLLIADGLPEAEVLLVSARTGTGLGELARALAGAAKAATASRVRLLGDVRRDAAALRPYVADREPELSEQVDEEMVEALTRSAGIPLVLNAVERDYRQRAIAATGWLFSRWLQRFRADPLRRLGLDARRGRAISSGTGSSVATTGGTAGDDLRLLLGRSSLPQATPAARAAVELTTRRLGSRAAAGLPDRWAHAAQDAATPDRPELADALDQAVLLTPLRDPDPVWWRLGNALQWLGALVVLGGLGWLTVIGILDWFRILSDVMVPMIGIIPLPTLLVAVGLLLGLLTAAAGRSMAGRGARKRRQVVERRLRRQVIDVAQRHLLEPVRAVLTRHRATRQYLDAATD